MILKRIFAMFCFTAMTLPGAVHAAAAYPDRPLRIITGGGVNDFLARVIASGISGPLGQNVVVENRPSTVIAEMVAKATPDGYTILVGGGSVWYAPLTQKMPYDPIKDLAPISIIGSTPYILFASNTLPVKTVKELIGYAKARPGQLNNSVSAPGSTSHLAGELFKSMAAINVVAVHYSSGAQEISDLIGGRVHVALTTGASLMELAKAGKVRALAVASAKPSVLVPDLPTIADSGVPGYEWGQANALFAPAKTPPTVIRRLNAEATQFLSMTEAKNRLLTASVEPMPSTPEQLSALIAMEMERAAKLLKTVHVRSQ